MGFGSDLLGELQDEQSRKFLYRAEVLSPIEIIRQATLVGARIVREEGRLGMVEPGAHADLLLLDGNPLDDLSLFQQLGAYMTAIMQGGKIHKYGS